MKQHKMPPERQSPSGLSTPGAEIEQQIVALLRQYDGVGILGGDYTPGFPICTAGELAMQLLGYDTPEEFLQASGGTMAGLVCENSTAWQADFAALHGAMTLHLRGKTGPRRVQLVKYDAVLPENCRRWLASLRDLDLVCRQEQRLDRLLQDKRHQEYNQQEQLSQMNFALERQNLSLERTLTEANRDREIISAVSKIYWMIYHLNLLTGTYEEIAVHDERHRPTGDRGRIADRFPTACRQTVRAEDQAAMLAFLDSTTLADRLQDRDEISQEYQTITGNWHQGRFIVEKRNASGRAIQVLYTIQIINEQKQKELAYEKRLTDIAAEARRANLSKTDFLRRMSHDIRTPIHGIRGMIEIANHYADDLEKQRECRDKVWDASGYLLSLVNSVLDMSRLEAGAVHLEHAPFNLLQLLSESNTVAQMQALEHTLHYHVDRSRSCIQHPYLIGSAPHLKQILMNIASNAVKYNRENGTITVWCQELSYDGSAATFCFACADTGIGMSPDFQLHAFEPFAQEGKSTTRTHYNGSGLGLSIVQALARQMGGSIDFTSRENEGTTFYVTLTFEVDPAPPQEVPRTETNALDLNGIHILLAEDNDLNMEIARFFIEQHGGTVQPAKNGQEAVDAFAAAYPGTFDLVLMDVMMPVLGGYAATRAIRAMDRPDAATIPILAMSANAFQDDIEKSLAAGMNEHLPKPISTDALLAAIRRHIPDSPA